MTDALPFHLEPITWVLLGLAGICMVSAVFFCNSFGFKRRR